MKCPNCETEMTEGVAKIRSTFGGFMAGFLEGLPALYFHYQKERSKVVSSGEKPQAFRCPKCSGTFVPGSPKIARSIDPETGVVTEWVQEDGN